MDHEQKPPQEKRVKKNSAAPLPEEIPRRAPYDPDAVDPERWEKIQKIKKALEDGTYRIDNEQVARKLIEHMREPER